MALLPDQSPEAVQFVVSLLVQLNVVEPLNGRFVGLAERLTTGTEGAATVTLTESFALPPGPVQDRLKLLLAISALMVWEPDVGLLPDQSPEAVQAVASVLFQTNVVEVFKTTLPGFAASETVGGSVAPMLTSSRGVNERSLLASEAL